MVKNIVQENLCASCIGKYVFITGENSFQSKVNKFPLVEIRLPPLVKKILQTKACFSANGIYWGSNFLQSKLCVFTSGK